MIYYLFCKAVYNELNSITLRVCQFYIMCRFTVCCREIKFESPIIPDNLNIIKFLVF